MAHEKSLVGILYKKCAECISKVFFRETENFGLCSLLSRQSVKHTGPQKANKSRSLRYLLYKIQSWIFAIIEK